MTATEPFPQVICGSREQRATGTWECVGPIDHPDSGHYYVRLNHKPEEPPA